MWKLESAIIVLSALFCFSQCQVPQGYVDVSSSVKSYTAQYSRSQQVIAVTLKNRIYTFVQDQNTINLTSMVFDNDQPQHVISCKLLTADPLEYFDTLSFYEILGNGKLLLIAPARTEHEKVYDVHITIDPFNCSSQRIVRVPVQHPDYILINVIPYHDSYDIITNYGFLHIQENQKNDTLHLKNPQRFNDKGEIIELDYFMKPDPTMTLDQVRRSYLWFDFSINTIKPFDASEGYYCRYRTYAKGDVLQRLDSRFEIVKEIGVKDYCETSVSTTQGHINYCSFKENNTICKLLNNDLEETATSELPKLDVPQGVMINRQVMNLPNHQGLVVFFGSAYGVPDIIMYTKSYTSMDVYLQRVNASGSAFPYYWKIGNTSPILFNNLYPIEDSKSDFCYVKSAINAINDTKIDFDINCLDF